MPFDGKRPTPQKDAFSSSIVVGGRELLANYSVARDLVDALRDPMKHREFGVTLHVPEDNGITVLKNGNAMQTFIVVGEQYAMHIRGNSLNERFSEVVRKETNTLAEFLTRKLSAAHSMKARLYHTRVGDSMVAEDSGILPAVIEVCSEKVGGVTNTTHMLVVFDVQGADIAAKRLRGNLEGNSHLLSGLPETEIMEHLQELARIPFNEHRSRQFPHLLSFPIDLQQLRKEF